MTGTIQISDVFKAASVYYRLSPTVLRSVCRERDVARPRQVAMAACRTLTTRSLPAIGRHFGGLDHTTVMHAIGAVPKIEGAREQIGAITELAERLAAERRQREMAWVREALESGQIIPAPEMASL